MIPQHIIGSFDLRRMNLDVAAMSSGKMRGVLSSKIIGGELVQDWNAGNFCFNFKTGAKNRPVFRPFAKHPLPERSAAWISFLPRRWRLLPKRPELRPWGDLSRAANRRTLSSYADHSGSNPPALFPPANRGTFWKRQPWEIPVPDSRRRPGQMPWYAHKRPAY